MNNGGTQIHIPTPCVTNTMLLLLIPLDRAHRRLLRTKVLLKQC